MESNINLSALILIFSLHGAREEELVPQSVPGQGFGEEHSVQQIDFAKIPDVIPRFEGLAKYSCLMKMCLWGKSGLLPHRAGNLRGLVPEEMPLQVSTDPNFP